MDDDETKEVTSITRVVKERWQTRRLKESCLIGKKKITTAEAPHILPHTTKIATANRVFTEQKHKL